MTVAKRLLTATLAAAALCGVAALTLDVEAAPNKSTKVVKIQCPNGWRGSAGGTYGGVSFGVACVTDTQSTTIEGVSGTAYTIRMGAESFQAGYDCFFSGDDANLNHTCAEVRISIR